MARGSTLSDRNYAYCCNQNDETSDIDEVRFEWFYPSSKLVFIFLKKRFDKVDNKFKNINTDIDKCQKNIEETVEILEKTIMGESFYKEVRERIIKKNNYCVQF